MRPSEFQINGFPVDGVVPKHETQAAEFLKKYPDFDGRGVVVGILDTGVDPGAAGLSITSDGKPKFKNIVDCTGAGDVETSKVVDAKSNGEYLEIEGLSGRTLRLSKEWKNPTGKWHIGSPMNDFDKKQEWSTFGPVDLLSYGVHVYEDGNITSIVTVCGTHGTHVAGIIGAHHPEHPELDGAAPGCQLVSLMIGDARLDSLETSHAFSRACAEIVKNKVDIINISFGEDAGLPNQGRVIELLRDELSGKRDVVIVSSAGNEGPAYTTVGAPGGTTFDIISVGAYVTGNMMQAQYNLLKPVNDTPYTWCSRGPTLDGDVGVSIYAPGGAITCVPPYSLQNSQLMNGTSMSSPSACGGISLILSALKAREIPYSASSIKKAVTFSAKSVRSEFEIGMLQVIEAYNYLVETKDTIDRDVSFKVSGPQGNRGIYLRESADFQEASRHTFTVSPVFYDGQESLKAHFEMQLTLSATEPWIQATEYIMMAGTGRSFAIRVDPTSLTPGFHFGKIRAYDAKSQQRRVVFEIPVTIMKPFEVTDNTLSLKSLTFEPSKIERRFITPPKGTTYAEIRIRPLCKLEASSMLWICTNQLLPQTKHKDSSSELILGIVENEVTSKTFKVNDGYTLELCLAQWWSSLEPMLLDIDVTFHGIKSTAGQSLCLNASAGYKRIDCFSLKKEPFKPKVVFDRFSDSYRPVSAVIKPLKFRDVLPDGQQLFETVITYKFDIKEKTEVTLKFGVPEHMYDNGFNGIFFMLFDAQKQLIHYGDMYPRPHELSKGEYTVRLQLISVYTQVLETFKDVPLTLGRKLKKEITLPLFANHIDFCDNKKADYGNATIALDRPKSFIIGTDLSADIYPSDVNPHSILMGSMKFNDKSSIPASMFLPPKVVEEKATTEDENEENLVRLEVDILSKLKGAEKDKHLKNLLSMHRKSLPVQLAKLDNAKDDQERLSTVDMILSLIDVSALSQYFSNEAKTSELAVKNVALENKMKEEKAAYIKALQVKSEVFSRQSNVDLEAFGKTVQTLMNWVEDSDTKLVNAKRALYTKSGQPALALQSLLKALEENGNSREGDVKTLLQEAITLCEELKWPFWKQVFEKLVIKKAPPYGYALF
ncbi:tripeptidyl-peptidase II Tpp2 [Schizosaccharomyces japonicus yFS275]|uniref:tripeptidyl-peptidase II n=1 Tax=Schizosaccharomyces japonicus (strain yFS275 / FY16936) TaxID=402676 RepID=B6K851_SCHJY|nr:tripeptidyl-peptidase II Tpp2 [Schizosaccharomyces japonicus yFS275]EEB09705.1 tripeptidyl-peptidase II Tpp2 [Schizosaccharomyces japonicus yFS275]